MSEYEATGKELDQLADCIGVPPRRPGETDADLRARVLDSVRRPCDCTFDGILHRLCADHPGLAIGLREAEEMHYKDIPETLWQRIKRVFRHAPYPRRAVRHLYAEVAVFEPKRSALDYKKLIGDALRDIKPAGVEFRVNVFATEERG